MRKGGEEKLIRLKNTIKCNGFALNSELRSMFINGELDSIDK